MMGGGADAEDRSEQGQEVSGTLAGFSLRGQSSYVLQ